MNRINGKAFSFSYKVFNTDDPTVDEVIRLGGKVSSRVTADIDYIVVGNDYDRYDNNYQIAKADSLKIPQLAKREFEIWLTEAKRDEGMPIVERKPKKRIKPYIKDRTFALTGRMFTERKNIISLINQLGGDYHDGKITAPNYPVDYLVVGERSRETQKEKDAAKHNVQMISHEMLKVWINSDNNRMKRETRKFKPVYDEEVIVPGDLIVAQGDYCTTTNSRHTGLKDAVIGIVSKVNPDGTVLVAVSSDVQACDPRAVFDELPIPIAKENKPLDQKGINKLTQTLNETKTVFDDIDNLLDE